MFDLDNEIPDYIESIPLITMEMEFKLDRIINFLTKAWGFASPKAFAESIINDTLSPYRLTIYNEMIGHVIETAVKPIV